MTRVTQKELAKIRGVSEAAISQAIKKGKITRGEDGLVDLESALIEARENLAYGHMTAAATAARAASIEAQRSGAPPPPKKEPPPEPSPSYMKARTLRETYLARLAKLDFEARSAQLVPFDQVKEDAFRLARIARDRVLGIADRLSAILAAESDPAQVHDILLTEAKSICDDLSNGLTSTFGLQ